MKSEVYSWRVSSDLKMSLEREARRREISMSAALDLAAREWLEKGDSPRSEEEEQRRLQGAALKCLGLLAGGDGHRSETVSGTVRQRVRRRNGR
ncbi:MAG TPA: hypothetical protein VKB79_22080 [Bryobacteraceae bacterium]|nr:hypothetical protein [Bryobacteraceae bacterium]